MTKCLFSCQPIGQNILQSPRVSLLRSAPEHVDFILSCYRNTDFMALYRLAQDREISRTDLRQKLQEEQGDFAQNQLRIEWVIFKRKHNKNVPIGLASLADYQAQHRRAELLLGVVNEQDRVGFVGLESTLLVLDFAFNQAKLNKVVSFVYGYNAISQKNTLHLGFQQEGLLREHLYTVQGYIDMHQNALLQREFRQNRRLSKLSKRLLQRDITQENLLKVTEMSKDVLEQFERLL